MTIMTVAKPSDAQIEVITIYSLRVGVNPMLDLPGQVPQAMITALTPSDGCLYKETMYVPPP